MWGAYQGDLAGGEWAIAHRALGCLAFGVGKSSFRTRGSRSRRCGVEEKEHACLRPLTDDLSGAYRLQERDACRPRQLTVVVHRALLHRNKLRHGR